MVDLSAYRVYGQPRISKPKELKGIKPAFSQTLNKSGRKCRVYLCGNDIYVYFFDLFSRLMTFPDPEDMALPTSALARKYPERFSFGRKEKFIYADSWGTIRERNEGYLRFADLLLRIADEDYLPRLVGQVADEFTLLSKSDERFEEIHGSYCQRWGDYFRFIDDMIHKIKSIAK